MRPIEVVQYETGVQLIFEVQDIDLEKTATATMFVRKPSGKFVFQEDNIYLTGNTVTVDLHNQALAEYGHPFFQIKFKKDEEVISTYSGMLSVDKSLEDSGAEESKTVIAAFDTFTDEQIARIEEATQSQIDLMKAEVEAKGLSVLSSIPDDYTEMVNRLNALYNSVANAIKGTVSGSVVRVDDVSPVEHNPVVRVHGKNLAKRTNGKDSEFHTGITYTVNSDGTVTASGTVTEGETSYYVMTVANTYEHQIPIRKGVYTVAKAPAEGCRIAVGVRESENEARVLYSSTYTQSASFKITSDTARFDIILCVDSGVTVDKVVFKPQIEEGSTATEYTPYIDPSTVAVTRCGKNLVEVTGATETTGGVTFTVNGDGSVTVNGTAETNVFYKVGKINLAKNGRFFLSGGVANGSVQTYMLYLHDVKSYVDFYDFGSGKAFTPTGETCDVVIAVYKGATANNIKFYPMVEAGEVKTSFKKFEQRATYTPGVDGSVPGIVPASSTMTLLTDTEGVTIACEYNRDTAKVVDNLTKAVVALGGVV